MGIRRRSVAVPFAVLAAVLIGGAAAWACATQPAISVQPASGLPGSQVKLSGASFRDGAAVEVFWGAVGGPRLATATGPSFSVTITVPQTAPDAYYIVAESSGGNASAAFRVTAPAAAEVPQAAAPEGSSSSSPVVEPAPAAAPETAPVAATRPAPGRVAAPAAARAVSPSPAAGPAVSPAPPAVTPVPVEQTGAPPAPTEVVAPAPAPRGLWSGARSSARPSLVPNRTDPAGQSASGAQVALGLVVVAIGLVVLATGLAVAGVRPRRRPRPTGAPRR